MMLTQSRLTHGVCNGCAGVVLCDDPHTVQDVKGGWWHTYCHDTLHPNHPHIDPVNVLVWLGLAPLSALAMIALFVWLVLT